MRYNTLHRSAALSLHPTSANPPRKLPPGDDLPAEVLTRVAEP